MRGSTYAPKHSRVPPAACLTAPGRLAGVATQFGVPQATDLLNETSRGVSNMADMLGGQVRQGWGCRGAGCVLGVVR